MSLATQVSLHFGLQAAFVYSGSFGYGMGHDFDHKTCPQALEDFEKTSKPSIWRSDMYKAFGLLVVAAVRSRGQRYGLTGEALVCPTMMCWLSPSPMSRMAAASFSSRTADEVGVVGNAPPADNAPRCGQRAAGGQRAAANRGSFNSNDFHGNVSGARNGNVAASRSICASANRNVNVNANRNVSVNGSGCCAGSYNDGPSWGGVAAGVATGAVIGAVVSSAASTPDICCTAGDLSARIRLAAAVLIIKASGRLPRPPPQPILRRGNRPEAVKERIRGNREWTFSGRPIVLERRFASQLLDVMIRAGILLAVVILCYRVFAPFLTIAVWALIFAVTLYPLHLAIVRRLNRGQGLSATLLVILGIAVLVVPTAVLVNSLGDTVQDLFTRIQNNTIEIPAPSDRVCGLAIRRRQGAHDLGACA